MPSPWSATSSGTSSGTDQLGDQLGDSSGTARGLKRPRHSHGRLIGTAASSGSRKRSEPQRPIAFIVRIRKLEHEMFDPQPNWDLPEKLMAMSHG